MTFAVLGVLLAAIDLYAWLFRPESGGSPDPLTVGMPWLLAAAIFTRPAHERPAILTLAGMFAAFLNRAVIPQEWVVHVLVLAGAVYVVGWTRRNPKVARADLERLALAFCLTVGAFLAVWLLQVL